MPPSSALDHTYFKYVLDVRGRLYRMGRLRQNVDRAWS